LIGRAGGGGSVRRVRTRHAAKPREPTALKPSARQRRLHVRSHVVAAPVSEVDSANPNAALHCHTKPSPTSLSCPSVVSSLVVRSRVPPPLLELAVVPAGNCRRAATFPCIVVPPHSLLSTAMCSGCRPPHLSSVFPHRSPSRPECPSTADASRLPHRRLRPLDIAGECHRHRRLSRRCPCRSAPLPVVQCASAGRAAPSRAVAVGTHAPRKHQPRGSHARLGHLARWAAAPER
jgi:hypothetical protein